MRNDLPALPVRAPLEPGVLAWADLGIGDGRPWGIRVFSPRFYPARRRSAASATASPLYNGTSA
jgi:hypothetical protein